MDFTFDFDRIAVYSPSDYNYELKDKIKELEKYKEETKINHKISLENTSRIVEHIQFHKEILNRHNEYYENIYKNSLNDIFGFLSNIALNSSFCFSFGLKSTIVKIASRPS